MSAPDDDHTVSIPTVPTAMERPEHRPTVTALHPLRLPDRDAPHRSAGSIGYPLLEVGRGPHVGTAYALPPGTTSLGRDRSCDISLDDPTVSRRHAEILRTSANVAVRDAGSLNGTYVNGEPCTEATTLNNGDEIWIGKFRLIFRDRQPAET